MVIEQMHSQRKATVPMHRFGMSLSPNRKVKKNMNRTVAVKKTRSGWYSKWIHMAGFSSNFNTAGGRLGPR